MENELSTQQSGSPVVPTAPTTAEAADVAEAAAAYAEAAFTAVADVRDSARRLAKLAAEMASMAAADAAAAAVAAAQAKDDARLAAKVRDHAAQAADKASTDTDRDSAEKAKTETDAAAQKAETRSKAHDHASDAAVAAASSVAIARVIANTTCIAADAGAIAARAASDVVARAATAFSDAAATVAAAGRARDAAAAGQSDIAVEAASAAEEIVAASAAAGPVEDQVVEDLASPRSDRSIKAMIWVGIAGVLGLVTGFFSHRLPVDFVAFVGLAIAWLVTVVTIGVSNDFPPANFLKRDKRLPWGLKTRHIWAAVSFGALSFSLAVATPSPFPINQPTVAAKPKCHVGVTAKAPQLVMVQCGESAPVQINLSGSKLAAKDQISIVDWVITEASTYISVDGSSVVEVRTSSDKETCIYSRDLSAPVEKPERNCLPIQVAEGHS